MTKGRGKVEFEEVRLGTGEVATREHAARVRGSIRLRHGDPVRALPDDWIDLKRRDVIAGIRYGVEGMRVGGHRCIVVPPHLGYGEEGFAPAGIPPGAMLICDIELLELRPKFPGARKPSQ